MSEVTKTCLSCNKTRKLVKAHIIPESFFRILRTDTRAPMLLTDKPDVYPKRAPIGVYDKNMLCAECEGIFQDTDDYGAKVLLHDKENQRQIFKNDAVVGFLLEQFDYGQLKRFFISILWRAHLSKERFFEKVDIGPYAPQAEKLIKSKDPGAPDQFAVMLSRFHEHYASSVPLNPHAERWDGVRAYRMYLGGYVVFIKTDKRQFPSSINKTIMRPGTPLLIPARDLETSNEFKIFKNIASQYNG